MPENGRNDGRLANMRKIARSASDRPFPRDSIVIPIAATALQIEALAESVMDLDEMGDDERAETLALLIYELTDELGSLALKLTDYFA